MPANIDGAALTKRAVKAQLLGIVKHSADELGIPADKIQYEDLPGLAERRDDAAEPYGQIGCYYVHGDQPGCIVGRWLNLHGVALDELSSWEGENAEKVAMHFMPKTPSEVLDFLGTVQSYQDDQESWKSAIENADLGDQ